MGTVIRRADLAANRATLIRAMQQHLHPILGDARYDWLYLNNPDGAAQVWVSTDQATGELVGSAAAIPRRMYVHGRETVGCVLADFWIHPRCRTLGPALQLQRACMASVGSDGFELCYDFPKSNMVAVYRRMGMRVQDQFVRLALPLRVDDKATRMFGQSYMAKASCSVGNFLLNIRNRVPRPRSGAVISTHEGPFGEEFTVLANEVKNAHGVCVSRSAEYLNWRYGAHFNYRHETLTARCGGALRAYLVFMQTGGNIEIADLFGADDPQTLQDLVAVIIGIARQRQAMRINMTLLVNHPWACVFERLGFAPRETAAVVRWAPDVTPAGRSGLRDSDWYLVHGDRDS